LPRTRGAVHTSARLRDSDAFGKIPIAYLIGVDADDVAAPQQIFGLIEGALKLDTGVCIVVDRRRILSRPDCTSSMARLPELTERTIAS
jgi:hypothetical protein